MNEDFLHKVMQAESELCSHKAALEGLQEERDALAAHIEALTIILTRLEHDCAPTDAKDFRRLKETLRAVTRVKEAAPTPSLARRDARVAADALEECFSDCSCLEADPPQIMRAHINRLLRKAGETKS